MTVMISSMPITGEDGFDLTLSGSGNSNISWYNDDTGEFLGSGSSVFIPFDSCYQFNASVYYYDEGCGCWVICCISFWLCPEDFCCDGDPMTFPWLQNLLAGLYEEFCLGCGGIEVYCCLVDGQPLIDVQNIPEGGNCGYPEGTVFDCEGTVIFNWGGPDALNMNLHSELSSCILLWDCSDNPVCIPEGTDPEDCDLFIYQTYPVQDGSEYTVELTNTTGYDVYMYVLHDADTDAPVDTLYPGAVTDGSPNTMICPLPGNYTVCAYYFCETGCVCPDIYDPVCVYDPSGNLITFPNACEANCAGYIEADFVACDGDCFCLDVYDPVCVVSPGGTTISFSNSCYANCAGYTETDFVDCNGGCICPAVYDPVCVIGPSGTIITYPNECDAFCDGYTPVDFVSCNDCDCPNYVNPVCVIEQSGDTITFQNACFAICAGYSSWEYIFCDGVVCDCVPFYYDPVCILINGVEYEFNNVCMAECAGFQISEFVPCNQVGGCPDVYDPVCVFDNGQVIEFSNSCWAFNAGYSVADFVPCEGSLFVCCKSFCVGCENESCVDDPLNELPWIYARLKDWDYENTCCSSGANPIVEQCWFNGQCVYHFTPCHLDGNGYVYDWQGNLIFNYNGFGGYNIHLASQLDNCKEIWNCDMGIPYVVEFEIGEDCGPVGSIVQVPVYVRNFIDIAAFQFSMHVENANVANFEGYSDFTINEGSLFFFGGAQTRTCIWDHPMGTGVTLSDNTVLFYIDLLITGTPGQTTTLTIDGIPTPFIVGDPNFMQLPAISIEGSICVSDLAMISGNIYKETGEMVALVDVMLSGDASDIYTTDATGYYEFNNLTIGGNYLVSPEKDINYTNGVNVLDITRIRQHILGANLFTSPYQYIAGDATNDQSVNVIDITQIRQLILGMISDFPNNTSWRFVPEDYQFSNPSDPLSSPFPEEISYMPLLSDKINEDYIAIKVGDVTNDSDPLSLSGNLVDRNLPMHYFLMKDSTVNGGEVTQAIFQTSDFQNITGFQFTLQYDQEVLEVLEISAENLPGFNSANFHLMEDAGVVTFAWTSPNGEPVSFSGSEELIKVTFSAKTGGGLLSEFVSIDRTPTEPLIFDDSGQAMKLQLEFIDLAFAKPRLLVANPRPNPFNDLTVVDCFVPETDEVYLSVFDVNGRQVFQSPSIAIHGYYSFNIKGKDIPGPGVYFIRVNTAREAVSLRLIKQ
jgi:hypothetical protein